MQGQINEAVKRNDPLLDAKFINEEPQIVKVIKKNSKVIGAGDRNYYRNCRCCWSFVFQKEKNKKNVKMYNFIYIEGKEVGMHVRNNL